MIQMHSYGRVFAYTLCSKRKLNQAPINHVITLGNP